MEHLLQRRFQKGIVSGSFKIVDYSVNRYPEWPTNHYQGYEVRYRSNRDYKGQ